MNWEKNLPIHRLWLNYTASQFFILATSHFPLGQWLLVENSESIFAQGKNLIWIPEYHSYMWRCWSPVYGCCFHIKMKQLPIQKCSPQAKPLGIIKRHILLAVSSCQHQHSPFFLHFIIDILARIYNMEARGEFTCSLSQNTTLIEKTEGNQSGGLVSGEWFCLERIQACLFYRQCGIVVRLRDIYRFDSWIPFPSNKTLSRLLGILEPQFLIFDTGIRYTSYWTLVRLTWDDLCVSFGIILETRIYLVLK